MSITHNNIADENLLYLPNDLSNFKQTSVSVQHNIINLEGTIEDNDELKRICPECYHEAQINNNVSVNLWHLCLGKVRMRITIHRKQYLCPHCHHCFSDQIPFKARHHFITKQLRTYIEDLLSMQAMSISTISKLTGIHHSIVKEIDKHRLKQLYNTAYNRDGSLRYCYRKSVTMASYLGIDEFSLHRHHQYATIIVNLETGEVLYVAIGKKKQVVYDFIKRFGEDFMKRVKAVACDMNAGYHNAFKEKYPKIEVVFDHFHLIKNFNDKIIKPVRQDEYERLLKEKTTKQANLLKGSKYLLMSHYDNLSQSGKDKLDQILTQNRLLFIAEVIKEELENAYKVTDQLAMTATIQYLIDLCNATDNTHFQEFAKLMQNHFDGIVAHAVYPISTGKVEGINNKIKVLKRQAYGYRDDQYFFLKILNATHKTH